MRGLLSGCNIERLPPLCGRHGCVAGDEAGAAIESEVAPQPGHPDGEAVAESGEEPDVDDTPQQPGDEAGDPDMAEIGNRAAATDRRHAAGIAIAETAWRPSRDRGGDRSRDVPTLLLGDGRDARKWPPVRAHAGGGVADREDGWAARHAEHRIDEDSPGAIGFAAEP